MRLVQAFVKNGKLATNYRWLKHQGLKYCLGMHELQKQPDETKGALAYFMEFIQTKVS